MKNLSHIEKSAFRRGEFVGYCNGAQRIIRNGAGWKTAGLRSASGVPVNASGRTLEELNSKLAEIAEKGQK